MPEKDRKELNGHARNIVIQVILTLPHFLSTVDVQQYHTRRFIVNIHGSLDSDDPRYMAVLVCFSMFSF